VIGMILGILVLLTAGFSLGLLRQRTATMPSTGHSGSGGSGRFVSILMLGAIGFPVGTIVLAKLLQSDLLGWVFGLTLMLEAALVACGAVFLAGVALSSIFFGRPRADSTPVLPSSMPLSEVAPPALRVVHVNRDSVHASDEAVPRRLPLSPETTLRDMLDSAMAESFLPSISGGLATWVVESSGSEGQPIAVCAQQWQRPVFLVAGGTPIGTHFGDASPTLNFAYRCQADPDAVLRLITDPIADDPQT
jgi:hypothetical protein